MPVTATSAASGTEQNGNAKSTAETSAVEYSAEKLLSFVDGVFKKQHSLEEFVAKIRTASPSSMTQLFDVLSIIDSEIEHGKEESAEPLLILKRIIEVLKNEFIPESLLSAELRTLGDATATQMLVRFRTRLYYKQLKFNLLREESEGYAKLITELVDNESDLSSNEARTRIFCLIGQFNLDPNRVCDVIMECFEAMPSRFSNFCAILSELNVNRTYLTAILGHNFSFYHTSGGTPFALYLVAAYLVTEGFVKLADLYAYLVPSTEKMKELRKMQIELGIKRAKKAEIIQTAAISIEAKPTSQLDQEPPSTAVGVSFATVIAQQEAEDEKLQAEFRESEVLGSNQKIGLTCAFAEIGQWKFAKELIDCMPDGFAVGFAPRIAIAINNMIEAAINDFYNEKCASYSLRASSKPLDPVKDNSMPKVMSWKELCDFSVILFYVGPRIALSPMTFVKLLRLVTKFYSEFNITSIRNVDAEFSIIPDILDEILIPGISLLDQNVGVLEEVWELIEKMSYLDRFRLYGRWKSLHTARWPDLTLAKSKVLGKTRYLLKRLSKETAKHIGRQLAKLCLTHPMTVFDYLLSQVQTFDNLIEPVVEGLRFVSSLGFDVLVFSIITQLATSEREQLNASDGSLSTWLQALATLTGAVLKKYSVELSGMLHYIAHRLRDRKGFDLLILREIVHNMGGVEAYAGLTDEHLQAVSGGQTLRQEGASFAGAKNRRAAARLRDALLKDDLAIGLYVLMAQQHQCFIYDESSEFPLKLTGELVDQCRDTQLQFVEFLLDSLRLDEYCKLVPPIEQLLDDYGMPLDVAMALYRPLFMADVNQRFKTARRELRQSEKDAGEEPAELNSEARAALKAKKAQQETQEHALFKAAFDDVLEELTSAIEPHISEFARNVPSKTYCMFWLLQRYDLEVPNAAYEREVDKVRRQISEANLIVEDRIRKKELDRLKEIEEELLHEHKRQKSHVERVHNTLLLHHDALFLPDNPNQTSAFLQTCLLARAIVSDADALYAAAFFLKLHFIKAKHFNTIITINKIYSDVFPLVLGRTENEAAALGRFLCSVMEIVLHWRSDEAIFDKECKHYPGFVTKVTQEEKSGLEFSYFQRLCFKYQYIMAKSFSLIVQQKGAEYLIVRNTLVLLRKLMPVFPVIRFISDDLCKAVDTLRANEKGVRDDISLKAASYVSHCKLRKVKIYESLEFSPNQGNSVPTSIFPASKKRTSLKNAADKKKAKIAPSDVETKKSESEKESENEKQKDKETPAPKIEPVKVEKAPILNRIAPAEKVKKEFAFNPKAAEFVPSSKRQIQTDQAASQKSVDPSPKREPLRTEKRSEPVKTPENRQPKKEPRIEDMDDGPQFRLILNSMSADEDGEIDITPPKRMRIAPDPDASQSPPKKTEKVSGSLMFAKAMQIEVNDKGERMHKIQPEHREQKKYRDDREKDDRRRAREQRPPDIRPLMDIPLHREYDMSGVRNLNIEKPYEKSKDRGPAEAHSDYRRDKEKERREKEKREEKEKERKKTVVDGPAPPPKSADRPAKVDEKKRESLKSRSSAEDERRIKRAIEDKDKEKDKSRRHPSDFSSRLKRARIEAPEPDAKHRRPRH